MKLGFVAIAGAVALLALGGPAAAETVVIELPWLLTTHSPVVSSPEGGLSLPAGVAAVHGATLRLAGVATEGVVLCDGEPPVHLPAPVEVEVYAHNPCTSALSAVWRCSLYDLSGAVDLEVPLVWDGVGLADPPVDWSCWLGGQMEVTVGWATALVGICGYEVTPTLAITRAELALEVTYTVAAEALTWGAIKAVYD